jgi:hypothetical protein
MPVVHTADGKSAADHGNMNLVNGICRAIGMMAASLVLHGIWPPAGRPR